MNTYLDIAKCPREQNHCWLRAILVVLADFFFPTENKNVDKAIKIIILLKIPLVFFFLLVFYWILQMHVAGL